MLDAVMLDPEAAAPLRRAPREADQSISEGTRRWLRELPPRRRPQRLCELQPRVANRIAWCWHDAALAARALDDLLTDRRGGRRGFPPVIVRELLRLREFNAQQRVDDACRDGWGAPRPRAA
jgi:hypothetical protein